MRTFMNALTTVQLRRALAIREQIDSLNAELASLIGGKSGTAAPAKARRRRRKPKISAEGRARIAAAQRARWAKIRREKK
jgi:hypothetical protein